MDFGVGVALRRTGQFNGLWGRMALSETEYLHALWGRSGVKVDRTPPWILG